MFRRALRSVPSVAASAVLVPAAAVWRVRVALLEAVGVGCVAVFAGSMVTAGAWLVVGVALVGKAIEIERRP